MSELARKLAGAIVAAMITQHEKARGGGFFVFGLGSDHPPDPDEVGIDGIGNVTECVEKALEAANMAPVMIGTQHVGWMLAPSIEDLAMGYNQGAISVGYEVKK